MSNNNCPVRFSHGAVVLTNKRIDSLVCNQHAEDSKRKRVRLVWIRIRVGLTDKDSICADGHTHQAHGTQEGQYTASGYKPKLSEFILSSNLTNPSV